MFAALALTLSVASAGCGSSSNGSDPGSGGGTNQGGAGSGGGGAPALDAACETYAQKICASEKQCFAFDYESQFVSDAQCQTQSVLACKQTYGANDSTATPAQITACAEQSQSCTFVVDYPACDLKGTRADGAACFNAGQCSSGLCYRSFSCDKNGQCTSPTCGVCQAPKAKGATCQFGECQLDLNCNSKNVCAAWAMNGDACADSTDCFNGFCKSGTCKPYEPIGGSCPTLEECYPYGGVECNEVTMKCVAEPVVQDGESCAFNQQTGVFPTCAAGDTCNAHNVCVKLGAVGDACTADSLNISNCAYPEQCLNGTCSLDLPAACR